MTIDDDFGDDLKREAERSQIPVELTGSLGSQIIEAVYAAHEADQIPTCSRCGGKAYKGGHGCLEPDPYTEAPPELARYDQDPGDEDDSDYWREAQMGAEVRRRVEERLAEMAIKINHYPCWLQIEWDLAHLSPVVGPYPNITQARKEATQVRKALKAANYPFKRVHVHVGRSPEIMWGWVQDREEN